MGADGVVVDDVTSEVDEWGGGVVGAVRGVGDGDAVSDCVPVWGGGDVGIDGVGKLGGPMEWMEWVGRDAWGGGESSTAQTDAHPKAPPPDSYESIFDDLVAGTNSSQGECGGTFPTFSIPGPCCHGIGTRRRIRRNRPPTPRC